MMCNAAAITDVEGGGARSLPHSTAYAPPRQMGPNETTEVGEKLALLLPC